MDLKKYLVLVVGCAFTLVYPAVAQKQIPISVEEVLEIAERNNANIQMAELEHKVSNANFHQTDAIFLPQVSVGYTAMTTDNPLNAFGFLLQQSIVTAQDFDPAQLNHPGASHNYAANVDVKLPLVNLDMLYARKGAKLQQEVYKHKAQYTKDYIRFEIQKAYTQLQFSYRAQSVLQSTLTDVKQIYQSVKNFYDQGLVQQSDVLNAQVQVNTVESALAKAESNIENASDGLKILMGLQPGEGDTYLPDSLTQYQDKQYSLDLSLVRSDVQAMQKALDASKAMVKSSTMNFMPRINAFGTYQFNDAKIFKFKEDSYMAGINLSWNIFSGNQNRSKLRAAKFQRDKMEKELQQYIDKSQLEISKNAREIEDLQFEIKQHQTSVEQASEALRILYNRFKEGLANTTDLLASQAQHSQQQLMLAQAVMQYNIAQAYQELLTTIK